MKIIEKHYSLGFEKGTVLLEPKDNSDILLCNNSDFMNFTSEKEIDYIVKTEDGNVIETGNNKSYTYQGSDKLNLYIKNVLSENIIIRYFFRVL